MSSRCRTTNAHELVKSPAVVFGAADRLLLVVVFVESQKDTKERGS